MMNYLQNGVANPLRGSCAHRQAYNGTRTDRVQTTYNVQFQTIARSVHHVGMSSYRYSVRVQTRGYVHRPGCPYQNTAQAVQTQYTLCNGTITVRVRQIDGKIVQPMQIDGRANGHVQLRPSRTSSTRTFVRLYYKRGYRTNHSLQPYKGLCLLVCLYSNIQLYRLQGRGKEWLNPSTNLMSNMNGKKSQYKHGTHRAMVQPQHEYELDQ